MNFAHLTDTELRSYLAVHPNDTAAAAQAVHRFCNPRIELEKAHRELRRMDDLVQLAFDVANEIETALRQLTDNLDAE